MAVKVAATLEPMGQGNFPVVAANNVSGLATVATTGSYNDLLDLPSNPINTEYARKIGTDTNHPAIGSESLPVYVNNIGQIKETKRLAFNNVAITPKTGGLEYQSTDLLTNYWVDPATAASNFGVEAWMYLLTFSAATITNTSLKVFVNNVEYHLGSEITNLNLQDICPNATSISASSAYQLYDENNTLLSYFGFVLMPSVANSYIPVADGVNFSGNQYPTAFESFSISIIRNNPVVESNIQVNTIDVKLIKNLTDIESNHLSLEADHINNTQYNILNTVADYDGLFYLGGISNIAYNTPITANIGGTSYTGMWYPADAEFPGYGGIANAYEYFGFMPYCYLTDKIVILKASNTCYLLVDNSVYSSLTSNDIVVYYSDSIDGKLTLKGQLIVTGQDSTTASDRGKITANSLSLTQGLQINNTVLDEATLQALIALLSVPPVPATLGIMSIVE